MSGSDEEIRALVAELNALMEQARPIVEELTGRTARDGTDAEEGELDGS
jgi:hypothetical protein